MSLKCDTKGSKVVLHGTTPIIQGAKDVKRAPWQRQLCFQRGSALLRDLMDTWVMELAGLGYMFSLSPFVCQLQARLLPSDIMDICCNPKPI